jgi:hypothetical protein
MGKNAELNFVRQQGLREASLGACEFQYPALMWQPRVIGLVVLVGLILQSAPIFIALAAILWWNVVLPGLNPFDGLYNWLIAKPGVRPGLTPAPAPRRFAQAMAASFMLGIGLCLLAGWHTLGWVLEGLLVVALLALIFGRFCLGSYVFLLITGQGGFANKTLPLGPS